MIGRLKRPLGICLIVVLFFAFSVHIGYLADWLLRFLVRNRILPHHVTNGWALSTLLIMVIGYWRMKDLLRITAAVARRIGLETGLDENCYMTETDISERSLPHMAHAFALAAFALGIVATCLLPAPTNPALDQTPLALFMAFFLIPVVFALVAYSVFLVIGLMVAVDALFRTLRQ